MNVLVVTAHDAVNLSIENVVREFIRRGHTVSIYAMRTEERHIRMFNDTGIEIIPISALNEAEVRKYDFAFCPMDGMYPLIFFDIYIFTYNFIFSTSWTSLGGDFMFVQTENRPIRQWEDCARMAVGSPKGDSPRLSGDTSEKNILFIDTGHFPFGIKGKQQIASMLISISEKYPDHRIIVKPRWLPNEPNQIHQSRIHLYDVINELCNSELPQNLILLNEHKDMENLIDQSSLVITPGSSAYLEAAMRGKRLLIVNGFDSDNSYEVRTDTVWKEQFEYFDKSGCLINYNDIFNYLPDGLKCKESHLIETGANASNVSQKMVDVIEYIYFNYLSKGQIPEIKKYNIDDYKESMRAGRDVTYPLLKSKRIKNRVLVMSRQFGFVRADIDYSEWLELLNTVYIKYPPTLEGLHELYEVMRRKLNEIWLDNAEELMHDDIDQSILLKAMLELGRAEESSKILSRMNINGPYHYTLGTIDRKQGMVTDAVNHYLKFLSEANSKACIQYPQEVDKTIGNVYGFLLNSFVIENIELEKFADVYIDLYEKRNATIAPYKSRKRAHNMIPKVAERLAETDPERALKCLQLYAKWVYHYNVRERDQKIKALTNDINTLRSSKLYRLRERIKCFIRKVKGGIKCYQEHGCHYTIRRGHEHICNYFGRISLVRLFSYFKHQILAGYKTYSEIVSEYGENTAIQITAGGNGDVYLVLKYYDAYIKKNFPEMTNVIVSHSGSFSQLMDWWKVSPSRQVRYDEWANLIRLFVFVGPQKVNINIIHHHLAVRRTGLLMFLEGIHGINYMDMHDIVLFDGIEKEKPVIDVPEEEIEQIFTKNDLEVKNTVVLSPYAKSLPPVPERYWTQLAERLKNIGMAVCTSAFGTQTPIMGTVKIELPFNKLERFFEAAGYLVSLRSGVDDITHDAICKRVEVYAKKTVPRSLVKSSIEVFAYSEHPIIVTNTNIDESIEETITQLGILPREENL